VQKKKIATSFPFNTKLKAVCAKKYFLKAQEEALAK